MLRRITLLLSILFLLNACGGGGDNSTEVPPDDAEKALLSLDHLKGKISPPPLPTASEENKTVSGVDTNNNNVRDEIEQSIYQAVMFYDEVSVSDYSSLIDIAKMFQPQKQAIPNSINELKIRCVYMKLPEKVRDIVSYGFIKSATLNTKERVKSFKESSIDIYTELEGGLTCGS